MDLLYCITHREDICIVKDGKDSGTVVGTQESKSLSHSPKFVVNTYHTTHIYKYDVQSTNSHSFQKNKSITC
jgi:hypothetical protein